ncbi:uncharacterized protein LOC135399079 [Ornithodoros turicata]|uniref:uncharacterized protein LOC135399079 n=1 Tax=Ornithodoros turicata TaxID=34597 RepID=UPI0031391293
MELTSLLFFSFIVAVSAQTRPPGHCDYKLHNCTEMVTPFLNDLRYMFPTTIQDVDEMCKMWSRFVDCVRRFVTECATEDQRAKFNNAVGDSIDTVHAICSSERYQREYLQNASCFRKVSVDSCGTFYNSMVEQVTNPVASEDHICCSYSQFKSCVSEPLLRLCGNRARTIMDHSMAFLIDRCGKAYYSLSYKCPRARALSISSYDTSTVAAITSTQTTRRPKKIVTTGQPRTIIYTLSPTASSRTSRYSSASTHYSSVLTTAVFLMLAVGVA